MINIEVVNFVLLVIILFLVIIYLVTQCVKETFYNPTLQVKNFTNSPIN
jgi:hypothetical protein